MNLSRARANPGQARDAETLAAQGVPGVPGVPGGFRKGERQNGRAGGVGERPGVRLRRDYCIYTRDTRDNRDSPPALAFSVPGLSRVGALPGTS